MNNEDKIISQSALPDTRPPELKDKDYLADEVASATAVVPFKNKKIQKLTATEYNQWYVGSCVPHGFFTQLEYEGIAPAGMSQLRAYRKRINYPQDGSIGVDIYDKIREGQSNDFPTPKKFREADATAMPYVKGEKIIPDFKYFQYAKNGAWDLDAAVKDVAVGKAVAIFIFATDDEWSQEFVEIKDPNLQAVGAEVRHCVCIIPKGDFTEKGKSWVSVHDSAKFGGRHLRYVSYDFLLKRTYFASKVVKATEIPLPPAPPSNVGLPLLNCEQGDRGDAVLALQKYLIDNEYLKAEYATGFYGAITSRAVLWFQLFHHEKFGVNIPQLLDWGGKYWGSQSIKVLKELEGN